MPTESTLFGADGSSIPYASTAPRRSGGLSRYARRFRTLTLATAGAMTLAALTTAASASAANMYEVDSTADAPLQNSASSACEATNGKCTLRAAVQAADNAEGQSTIILPAGTYTLAVPSTTSSSAGNGDLDVTGGTELTIEGDEGAASTIINAGHVDRAFAVHAGESLTIKGVTVTGGSGGASDSISPTTGGAFYNDGSLTIEESVLTGNSTYEDGGVIYSGPDASLTKIYASTVTQNAARSEGGVLDVESGRVELAEDTITHNSADSDGGVLYVDESGHTKGVIDIADSELLDNVSYSDGGALDVEHTGKLEVGSSTFSNDSNDDEDGGAIYADETEGFGINASHFVADTSGDSEGGAIYADKAGPMTVNGGSTFENDTAGDSDGGAIYADDTALSVAESSFHNDVGDEGGALYLSGQTSTTEYVIELSTFTGNAAVGSEGGAIYDSEGALTIKSSTLASNNASDEGGALYYDSGDALLAVNDTFDGNQAGFNGGAIDLYQPASEGEILLLNDTIAHNTAYQGGGIYKPENAGAIQNTIVADNVGGATADGGGDCYGTRKEDNAAGADRGGNIDSDGSCFSNSTPEDHVGVDPKLGELANNGGGFGPVELETDALLPGSPAIQAGVETAADCPSADERGVTRTDSCDAGAFQAAPADVSLTVTPPSKSKTIGEVITYGLEVVNHGPAPATGIVVTDTIPAGTTYYSSEIGYFGEGFCRQEEEGRLICTVGFTLGADASVPITINVVPSEVGTPRDTAEVSTSSEDPEPANNTASAEATVISNERVVPVETIRTVEVTKTVDVPTAKQTECKSARSETISWKVPGGVSLRRIVITRNGKVYKTLAGSARKVTVSMAGLPKGAVPVKITGYAASGQRYVMTRTFHLCVPAKEGGGPSSNYLTKE